MPARRTVYALLAVLLAAASYHHARRPLRPTIAGVPGEGFEREEAEGDVERRREWFLGQRMYPSGAIPPDARRRALLSFRGAPAAKAASAAWTPIGPAGIQSAFPDNWGPTSGRVNAIAVSPADPLLVLVGAATGGVWRSTDGGATFVPTSDNQVDLAVGSIAFAASDPAVVYAGMGDKALGYLGTGVLRSTDAGRTWARVSDDSLPAPGTIARVAVDPADPDRVYAAQYSTLVDGSYRSSGFFRSTDGGVRWARTLAGLPRDVVLDPSDPRTLYLGMARVDENGLPAGVYKSTDGGGTWANSFRSPFDFTSDAQLAVSPAAPGTVYLLTGGYTGSGFGARLLATANSGGTWTQLGLSGVDTAQFGYNSLVAVDPTNASVVYVGTRDFYRSADGGTTWTPLTKNFEPGSGRYHPDQATSHPDQHAFAFAPDDASTIYIGNDGGISKSSDRGFTFTSLNATLALTQFTSLAVHPTNPAVTYGGTQDNGTERHLSGTTWEEFISGDGGNCVVDPLDPSIVYTTYVLDTVFRFAENGTVFDDVIGDDDAFGEPPSNPRVAFYPPFTGNGVDSRLYFGTWRLFVSEDRGDTWTAPAGTLDLTRGDGVLTAIGVSRSDPNVIYTGASDGRVMTSVDGGATWKEATAGLPNRFVTDIEVAPNDPATAYLTVSGFGSGHVFKTTNGGQRWTDVSANLPDIPTNAVLVDPLDPATLYVGTDVGVFTLPSGGAEWAAFNDGLPPVVVTAFAAQASGLIQVATYGRGAYQLGAVATPPSVLLTAPNRGAVKAGASVTITWTTTPGDLAVASHAIRLSIDGGQTYPIAVADGLPGAARSFEYAIPADAPKTKTARFLVVAADSLGNEGQDASDRNVKIKRRRG